MRDTGDDIHNALRSVIEASRKHFGHRFDDQGNLWSSATDGVHCFSPDGILLGKIKVPQTVANLTFGGPRRNRLFVTATTFVYAIYLTTNDKQRP
ncbi:SMP-30/gluconolactonase/LRE family protein (plasmid) [Rhizobium tumorigenes]|nr:SMP-30/gluconolactonase/LRE family protein [Rhizobium tumorigenes]WFS03648.1 SMP-30/gluconolactonase/LRE family protein [Rhizobium tumorigenes]